MDSVAAEISVDTLRADHKFFKLYRRHRVIHGITLARRLFFACPCPIC